MRATHLGCLEVLVEILTEHYGVPVDKIDIITASMGYALATDGGFCTGSVRVVDHQRLSSSGYVFSASLPPYLASAAISAIDILEENHQLLGKLRGKCCSFVESEKTVSGTNGRTACMASYVVCTTIFNKIMGIAGDKNVTHLCPLWFLLIPKISIIHEYPQNIPFAVL
ncbi:hypothetical protein IFM89_000545 [Coptis chinensis]|uniref:serine C-palmitoyltransferase n=1 Tax=Coptis chinensis TaxID=261450 RepID=A0A835H2H2_9MAGN|nr:hypothetical protein IFM89_000545 [Coptis chinensis]